MGWGLGGGGFGGFVNSITGASQSARQQNQYAVAMSRMNFKQQKDMYEWQAKEGPKMQMEGYANAGVNPIYGLGGLNPSAGAGGTGGAPGGGAGGGIALISALADIYNNTRLTNAQIDNMDSVTDTNDTGWLGRMIGGKTAKKVVNSIDKDRQEWNAKAPERKKKLEKANKELGYFEKLFHFEAKKR